MSEEGELKGVLEYLKPYADANLAERYLGYFEISQEDAQMLARHIDFLTKARDELKTEITKLRADREAHVKEKITPFVDYLYRYLEDANTRIEKGKGTWPSSDYVRDEDWARLIGQKGVLDDMLYSLRNHELIKSEERREGQSPDATKKV